MRNLINEVFDLLELVIIRLALLVLLLLGAYSVIHSHLWR